MLVFLFVRCLINFYNSAIRLFVCSVAVGHVEYSDAKKSKEEQAKELALVTLIICTDFHFIQFNEMFTTQFPLRKTENNQPTNQPRKLNLQTTNNISIITLHDRFH
jgi:hypothetical protein